MQSYDRFISPYSNLMQPYNGDRMTEHTNVQQINHTTVLPMMHKGDHFKPPSQPPVPALKGYLRSNLHPNCLLSCVGFTAIAGKRSALGQFMLSEPTRAHRVTVAHEQQILQPSTIWKIVRQTCQSSTAKLVPCTLGARLSPQFANPVPQT